MDGQQISFLDLLFHECEEELCSSMKDAVKNEFGVFRTNSVMFHSFNNIKESVTIKIAKKTPFVYYAFECCNNTQGKVSPLTDDKESRFLITDCKESVLKTISERLKKYCNGIVKSENVEKVLNNMRDYI